jgi:hypothetical protein
MRNFLLVWILIFSYKSSSSQTFNLSKKYKQISFGKYCIKDTNNKKIFLNGCLIIDSISKSVDVNFQSSMYIYHFTFFNYFFKGKILQNNFEQLIIKIDSLKYDFAIGSGFSYSPAQKESKYIFIEPFVLNLQYARKQKKIKLFPNYVFKISK